MWDGLNFIHTGTAQQPSAFQNPKGNVTPVRAWGSTDGKGREGLAFPGCPGARDAQGVRAPGWEFCSPSLSSNLRPVEIRDQQNKSSCSSSLSLAFSQAGFCWEGSPIHCAGAGTGCAVGSLCVLWDEFLLAERP